MNSNISDSHTEDSNPNNTEVEVTAPRRGRPKSSKNKLKPRSIEIDQSKPFALIVDGIPNLPEGKITGRPLGRKNSSPRKQRAENTSEQETL